MDAVLVATVALVLVRGWVLEPVEVPTGSMAPTLAAGSHVLVDHLGPRLGGYHRGDVVVLTSPLDGTLLVKRVAGVAGDDVAILDGVLHVDGRPVREPWVDPRDVDSVYSELGVVPEGHVLVLADHRPEALDSRTFGPVPLADLRGRVLLTVWPPADLGWAS